MGVWATSRNGILKVLFRFSPAQNPRPANPVPATQQSEAQSKSTQSALKIWSLNMSSWHRHVESVLDEAKKQLSFSLHFRRPTSKLLLWPRPSTMLTARRQYAPGSGNLHDEKGRRPSYSRALGSAGSYAACC